MSDSVTPPEWPDRTAATDATRGQLAEPDIDGAWVHHSRITWFDGTYNSDYDHPQCPVREKPPRGRPCKFIAERVTSEDGAGAWQCPHDGVFRVYGYPRTAEESEQATLGEVDE